MAEDVDPKILVEARRVAFEMRLSCVQWDSCREGNCQCFPDRDVVAAAKRAEQNRLDFERNTRKED
jgi:hypothetical protein